MACSVVFKGLPGTAKATTRQRAFQVLLSPMFFSGSVLSITLRVTTVLI